MAKNIISVELIEDIKNVGIGTFHSWLVENEITVSLRNNFFYNLEIALEQQKLTIDHINQAISEIEENSDKKIHLYEAPNFEMLKEDKKKVLKHLRESFGIAPSPLDWGRVTPKKAPTFNYLYWDDKKIKLKFSELQYDYDVDIEDDEIIKTPKKVYIIFIIDLSDGFTQIRFDGPGKLHMHKNEQGKRTESAFENYYKDLLVKLFPDILFHDMNLNGVANYITAKEKKKFRINKEVTTITGNAKQTFASGSIKTDIRDLPEHSAAVSTVESKTWLTEDLTGYWLAEHSDSELAKDLFMRISRRVSEIRVQRGCLEKELNYGLKQIREIQAKV